MSTLHDDQHCLINRMDKKMTLLYRPEEKLNLLKWPGLGHVEIESDKRGTGWK